MDMTGWCFFNYPSEKYESVGMMIIPNGKIKHVPNHQPEHEAYNISMVCICYTHTHLKDRISSMSLLIPDRVSGLNPERPSLSTLDKSRRNW